MSRIPRPPVGTPDFTEQLDTSSEFDAAVAPLVVAAVQHNAGVPHDLVVVHVMRNIRSYPNVDFKEFVALVEKAVDAVVARGDVCRLDVRAENRDHSLYYPRASAFVVTPAECMVDARPAPPAYAEPLDANDTAWLDSLSRMVAGCPPAVRVRMMGRFCPRCGAASEGHVCNV